MDVNITRDVVYEGITFRVTAIKWDATWWTASEYSKEDQAAFMRGEWCFVKVTTTPMENGKELTDLERATKYVRYGNIPSEGIVDIDYVMNQWPVPSDLIVGAYSVNKMHKTLRYKLRQRRIAIMGA